MLIDYWVLFWNMMNTIRHMATNIIKRRPILTSLSLGALGLYTHFTIQVKSKYKDGLYKMQQEILNSHINHERVSFEQRAIITESGKTMNTAIFGKKGDHEDLYRQPIEGEKVLVMVHGWGAGYPLFSSNINALIENYDRIVTFDLHGFGLSQRTYFRGGPQEAKDYFLKPIRELMESLKLSDGTIHMMGHSLGGYLACEYAYEYPEHLEKVTLVAPVGFDTDMFSQARQNPSRFLKFMSFLVFDCGVTPQHIIRFFGPLSERIWMKLGVASNYRNLNELFWKYLYYNQVMPSGGDRAFMAFLSRDGWNPGLLDRIHLMERVKNVQFIYGAKDYIKPAFAQEHILPKLQSHPSSTFNVVHNAGHHMYYENEPMFNEFIRPAF